MGSLRDEGEAYGRKLDEAGVKVTTVRYEGMIHDFGLLNGLAEEPAVRSLFEDAAAELKRHLQQEGQARRRRIGNTTSWTNRLRNGAHPWSMPHELYNYIFQT